MRRARAHGPGVALRRAVAREHAGAWPFAYMRCPRSCTDCSGMQTPGTTVERDGRTAIVHLRGDLVIPTVGVLYTMLRGETRRRDVAGLVLDFTGAGRIDSS